MARWNADSSKNFLQSIVCLWLVFGWFASSVEPRVMTSSWYRVTTKAVSSLLTSVTGRVANGEEVVQEEQWHENIQSAFVATKESVDGFLNDLMQGENPLASSLEAGRVKLEQLRSSLPEMPTLGIDTEYFKNHIAEFDWNSFSAQLMSAAETSAEEDKDPIDEMNDIPPECSMETPEMIRHAGYPVEVHTATTSDGYVLHLHRIPHSPPTRLGSDPIETRPVVFLQHGILADSACWVASGPGRSLPYLLADAGCDVWLGNVRGNTYSRAHETMDAARDERYWRFSWQDMAEKDLPAMVDKALEVSGHQTLYYVGHSQGSLIAFARLSEDPEMNKKIRTMFALGPVATLAHITSPVKSLTFLSKIGHFGISLFGATEILPHSPVSRLISAKLHKIYNQETHNHTIGESVAYHGNNLMMFLSGVHPGHYYADRMPIYSSHTPAGTSLHNLLHMSQLVETGRMQKWDYMSESENVKAYGSKTPPEYNVSNIRTPLALFVGTEDQLADPEDSAKLATKLNSLFHYKLLEGWDHLDFLWGKAAAGSVYKDVIEFVRESEHARTHKQWRANDEL